MDIPDIEAFPLLDSSARCPKFEFKYVVNVPAGGITGEAMLLLRIYTLDVNSGELVVIGNSIIRVFNENENDEVNLHLTPGGGGGGVGGVGRYSSQARVGVCRPNPDPV